MARATSGAGPKKPVTHSFGRSRPGADGSFPLHRAPERNTVTDTLVTGRFYQVPRPQEPYTKGNQLIDYFEFDWRARKYVANTLSSS